MFQNHFRQKPASMKVKVVAVLFLICATGALAQDSCPDPTCVGDPCANQECDRFLNAECRPDPCECAPNFFWKGKNVTARCKVETCAEKICMGRHRRCEMRIIPPTCPARVPRCRQYRRSQCILVRPNHTMSCREITCKEEEVCRMRNRGVNFPPVIRCVALAKQRNCLNIMCKEGFVCQDMGRRIRCVPGNDTTPVTTITTSPPSTPTISITPFTSIPITSPPSGPFCTLEFQLNCTQMGQECVADENGQRCFVASTCEQIRLICTNRFQVCIEEGGSARCIPATTCSQLRPICKMRNPSLVCEITNFGGFMIPTCAIATSCDQLECMEGENCIVTLIGNTTFPQCIRVSPTGMPTRMIASTCRDLQCPPTTPFCSLTVVPSENASVAVCADQETLEASFRFGATCESLGAEACDDGSTCVNFLFNATVASTFCTTANCTGGSNCNNDTTCEVVSGGSSSNVNSICLPTSASQIGCTLGGTTCPGNTVCYEAQLGGTSVQTFCSPPVEVPPMSCKDLPCEEGQVCSLNSIDILPDLQFATCIDRRSFLASVAFLQNN